MIEFIAGITVGFVIGILMFYKDARRYGWLREYPNCYFPEEEMVSEEELDEAIDEFLAGKKTRRELKDEQHEPWVDPYPYPNNRPMPGPQPLFGDVSRES